MPGPWQRSPGSGMDESRGGGPAADESKGRCQRPGRPLQQRPPGGGIRGQRGSGDVSASEFFIGGISQVSVSAEALVIIGGSVTLRIWRRQLHHLLELLLVIVRSARIFCM